MCKPCTVSHQNISTVKLLAFLTCLKFANFLFVFCTWELNPTQRSSTCQDTQITPVSDPWKTELFLYDVIVTMATARPVTHQCFSSHTHTHGYSSRVPPLSGRYSVLIRIFGNTCKSGWMKDKIIQEVYTQRYRAGTYRLNEMSRQYVRHKHTHMHIHIHTHTHLGCVHISAQITSENNSLHFISPWYQLRLLYISEKHLDFFSPCLPALFSLSGLFFYHFRNDYMAL